ncbi:MAG: stalk domain-containing protein [Clostridiaceae bacterium]|nr:stalk domain-containing protein [Clostridiaceae bacterium]
MVKNTFRIVSALVAVCLIAVVMPRTSAATQNVTVELDGETLTFSGAQPYYDSSVGRVYVPVRDLCEAMDAVVNYDEATKTITITRGGTTLKLRIGVKTATVNGVAVALDAPPFAEDGSTYVPLRFVSENLLLDVVWNAQNAKVTLTSSARLTLGMPSEEAKNTFGEPSRTSVSEKGYTWWIYDDLDTYKMIGVSDSKVVAYYLHSSSWQVDDGLRFGMTAADCDALLASIESVEYGTYTVYTADNKIKTLFYDENGAAYAILEEIAEYAGKTRISVAVLDGYARQFLDLVNIERHKLGLTAIVWDETICDVARNHSNDMAKNNLYTHNGSDNTSPVDRLNAAGYTDFYQIEIIARAFPNALTAFSAHLNNAQYRAVLRANYTTMGAGVAYNPQSDGILYYTQVFYTSK